MRRALGWVLSTVGWVLVVYFGILASLLLLGVVAQQKGSVAGVVTAIALPVGVGLIIGGLTIRHRGPIWKGRREREYRRAESHEGPFGHPRGEC